MKAQLKAMGTTPTGRRWPRKLISICLSLFLKNPAAYDELRSSNMLILPSGRHLQRYKNFVHQIPGINTEIFIWMYHSAIKNKVPDVGFAGGPVHDETSILNALVLQKLKNGKVRIIGFIDSGEKGNLLRTLKKGAQSSGLAKSVIQINFQGYTGFRFPVCHYPVDSVKTSELYVMINAVIAHLHDYGFIVDYVMADGDRRIGIIPN